MVVLQDHALSGRDTVTELIGVTDLCLTQDLGIYCSAGM